MGKFIDDKLGKLKTSLGFDFMEMAQLAQKDSAEFLRRKKEIFRQHFPDLGDDELEEILAKLNLTPAQGGDEPLDTVVANLVQSFALTGNGQDEIVEIVKEGAKAMDDNCESIKETCMAVQETGKKIIQDCQGTVWHLCEIGDNMKKTFEGIQEIDKSLAIQEAAQIPEEKKH